MPGISVSDTADALWSTTLRNASGMLEDNITTGSKLFYFVKKQDNYKVVDNLGYQVEIPLMYGLANVDSYAGYDVTDTTPVDGITVSLWDWRSASTSVTISGEEEAKNRSDSQKIDLLSAKTKQSEATIIQFFDRALLQGNGINSATAVKTAYTSTANGSVFVDPLPKLVDVAPSTGTVGSLNSATYDWWRNQFFDADATTFAGFRKNLNNMRNRCSKGVKGTPDLHVVDQNVFELYTASLDVQVRNMSYTKADIPFENVLFHGEPVVWDEYVPDAGNSTTASIPVASSGTWYMLNSKHLEIRVDKGANFKTTDFVRPHNQDAKTALILWRGVVAMNNRRKHGVLFGIDTTIVS